MGEREREREREKDRPRMGSLWIDYVLLPGKLEMHLASLASGSGHGPFPADLITMFLEQVLVNHKATLANIGSAVKDADDRSLANDTSKMGKTAALLCERAARVAVVSKFSLADIETAIPSQQHQFLLLRALMIHDTVRFSLHLCNLHRWRIHNALHTHFLGSSAIHRPSSSARVNSWTIEEDLADLFNCSESSEIVNSGAGGRKGAVAEEENVSVEFLERVFYGSHYPMTALHVVHGKTDLQTLQCDENGAECINFGNVGFALSEEYRCQALFDVAEVHFMRGRIERALDVFTLCGEHFARLSSHNTEVGSRSIQENIDLFDHQNLTFPKDRLAGFIVACRMLLAKGAATRTDLDKHGKSDISKTPLPKLGAPSPSQAAVIACEQSRWNFTNRSLSDRYEGLCDLHTVGSGIEVNSTPKRCTDGSYFGLHWSKRMYNCVHPAKSAAHGVNCGAELYQKNGETTMHSVDGSKGGDLLGPTATPSAMEGPVDRDGSQNQYTGTVKDRGRSNASIVGQSQSLKEDSICLSQSVLNPFAAFPPTPHGKELVQTFVDDLRNGFLSWGYCLSLEKDPKIPASVQCELAACNIVREVVEGAPLESFLRISQRLKRDEKAMGFCLRLVYSSRSLVKGATRDFSFGGASVQYNAPHVNKKSKPQRGTWQKEGENLARRMDELALYMCCVIDKPWCWALSTEIGFFSPPGVTVPGLRGLKGNDDSGESTSSRYARSLISDGMSVGILELQQREQFLLELLLADNISDYEIIVSRAKQLVPAEPFVTNDNRAAGSALRYNEEMRNSFTGSSRLSLPLVANYCEGELSIACTDSDQSSRRPSFGEDMAAFLRRKAFDTLENLKDVATAMRLYELAVVMDPMDADSELMLWLLEKLVMVNDITVDKPDKQYLSDLSKGSFPCFSLLEYVLQCLIEQESWVYLAEVCQWGMNKLKVLALRECDVTNSQTVGNKGNSVSGYASATVSYKKKLQTLKVATTLGDLVPLCGSILISASKNNFTEDAARLRPTSWQLYEEFLCLLAGVEIGNPAQGGEECIFRRPHGTIMAVVPPPSTGVNSVPLIPRIKNARVLTTLASLTAGWLQRCHAAGLTPWALAVERYGVLAAVTAGASLPPPVGSLPHSAGIYRSVSSKVPPEYGRDLFRVLLEGIAVLPEGARGDENTGHCWLQGLADLAFEDEDYVKALQLYLQAGGIRSSHYCDPSSSMPRDIFSVWVIRRMINACRAIGAGLQAAILCQCLPQPDYEFAFRLLQEHSPILDSDAAAYFQCIWEVPILELLVHLHEKAGEEARVSTLMSYLQHPAMNVHNPQSIRKAHISAMEQLFLQRLCEELLG